MYAISPMHGKLTFPLPVADLLHKLKSMTDGKTELYWLEKAHEFEGTLDIVRLTQTLPATHRNKWHEFEGRNRNFILYNVPLK